MFWLFLSFLTIGKLEAEAPRSDLDNSTDTVLVADFEFPKVIQIDKPLISHVSSNCEQYRPLIAQYDWDVEIAIAVCGAESGGNAFAVNEKDRHKGCMGSSGLFQIACIHRPIEEMKDPSLNIKQAYKIYSERNSWKPWGAFTNKSYLKYL